MADADRTPSHFVTFIEELARGPESFDFYQAVRRLDCARRDVPPTGQSARAADEPVRFGQEVSLAFAPSTLHAVEQRPGRTPRLIQRFFGLLGPQGPLPLHITEYIRDRVRNHEDSTLLRFLDVFHHRMISLFYRAWARVRPTVSFDQPETDRFSDYIGTLFGIGMRSLQGRDALTDLPKRHFAGLMSCQTKHADGLLAILSGYFRLPVQVDEFVGQWIELPSNCRSMVGLSSSQLGVNTTVGSHVWDCQQKFRVVLGPLDLDYYYRMLPGGGQLFVDPTTAGLASPIGETGAFGRDEQEAHLGRFAGAARDGDGIATLGAGSQDTMPDSVDADASELPSGVHGWSRGGDLDDTGSAADVDQSKPAIQLSQTPESSPMGGSESESANRNIRVIGLESETLVRNISVSEPMSEAAPRNIPMLGPRSEVAPANIPMQGSTPATLGGTSTDRDDPTGRGDTSSSAAGANRDSDVGRPHGGSRRRPVAWRAGASLDRLAAIVRAYVGDELEWDLKLILRKEDVPPLGLGVVGQLGWSSWLARDPLPYDPDDLVLAATQLPDNAEVAEFRAIRGWNRTTLGQTRDGRFILVQTEAAEHESAVVEFA